MIYFGLAFRTTKVINIAITAAIPIAAVPLIVLYFCYNGAISYILTRFNVLTGVVDFIPVWQIYQTLLPISLGLGIGIGLIGSFFTTRKHLRV